MREYKAKMVAKNASKAPKKKGTQSKKKKELKIFIECKKPVEDGIMNAQDFLSYVTERIKVCVANLFQFILNIIAPF